MEHVTTPRDEVSQAPVDSIVTIFQSISINSVLIVLGVLPIIFIPIWYAPFTYTKSFLVVVVLLLAIILYSLSVLRSGTTAWLNSSVIWALWGVVATGVISGLFSGDLADAFIGNTLNVHTVFFMVLVALVTTFIALQAHVRGAVMRFYIALTASGLLLALYHIVRLLFGPDTLGFGVFTTATSTPIGGWNDLGLFFGLTILLSIVALNMLPLTKPGRLLFGFLVVLSLVMLTVINFFSVWLVLALASMVILMYSLAKDRFVDKSIVTRQQDTKVSLTSLILTLATFIISFAFVIAGASLGSIISNATNVSYVEVRPSPVATLNVARAVYGENLLLGSGPNKFVDAWRTHKDASINETIFWDTNFTSGSGFIPTQLVTHGVLGSIAWIIFIISVLYTGFRLLIHAQTRDTLMYFISTSSLVAVVYIWGMALVYTPGVAILLLGAAFTGIFITAYTKAVPQKRRELTIGFNKRAAFILVSVVMLIIVAGASVLYYAGRHYSSVWMFSEAVNNVTEGTSIESVETKIAAAFSVYQSDTYAEQLAQFQLTKMNSLLAVPEPTAEQQAQFENAAVTGINAIQQAIALDPTEPRYWGVLGALYTTLAIVGIEEADARAREAYQEARTYDPKNPSYPLLTGRLEFELENLVAAREKVNEAITLKSNFTSALAVLAQIEIAEGSVAEAIATTRSITSIEPNNAARFYQLGTLQLADEDVDGAIRSLERAVQLDQNYANARYFLALAYLEQDNTEAALEQLRVVRDLNPDNQAIAELITQLESGEPISVPASAPENISDGETVVEETDDTVTTNESPDTNLITPVNPTSDTEQSDTNTESLNQTDETTTNE